jgi:transposase
MKHKSEDYKTVAVQNYLQGDKTQQEICDVFHCTPRSLMRWVDKYRKTGKIENIKRTPIAYKIKKEQVNFLIKEIKNNKTITMEDLLVKLKMHYPDFNITRRHLQRVVKQNNITLKLTRVRHEPVKRFGKDVDINRNLEEFYKEVKKYKIEDIICIDETSINGLQKRNHCYNDIGKRCVIKTTSQDVFKKYTGVFAISSNGVEGWELYEKGGINADRLSDFLTKFITEEHKNKLIILDNASSHRNPKIKELINKNNQLLHSVVYQHFTNSIENFFSVLKSRLRKEPGITYSDLKRNISNVIGNIPKVYFYNILKGAYNNRDKKFVKVHNRTMKRPKKNYL